MTARRRRSTRCATAGSGCRIRSTIASARERWRARNATRGRTLAAHAERADRFATRLVGLMGRRAFPAGDGLLLEPATAVHTFALRFPLDLLYLDRNGVILRVQEGLAPWRLGALRTPGCRAILELPAGTIEATGSRVGDRVTLEPADD